MTTSRPKLIIDSATLIILCKHAASSKKTLTRKSSADYNVLVFRRPANASFAANAIVFPGGACEKADDAEDWIEFYKNQMNISDAKFNEITSVAGKREFIFKKTKNHHLEREISLRITAIREAFEEIGLLFCKTREQFKENDKFSSVYENFDVLYWQNEVHNDASKFLKLCKFLNVAPDLWNSYEWSSWVTPYIVPKRYETAFFLITLLNEPKVYPESLEVAEYMWESPEDLIELHYTNKIWIPTPQFYEICRLNSVKHIEEVIKFAKKRNNNGITSYNPIPYILSDGVTTTYPGDDYYVNHLDLLSFDENEICKYKNKTLEEFRKLAKNLNRSEHNGDLSAWNSSDIFININPLDGHLTPVKTRYSKL